MKTRVFLTPDLIDQIWDEWNKLDPQDRNTAVVANNVRVSPTTVYRVVSACIHASYGNRVWYDPRRWPNAMMVKYLNEEKFADMIALKESKGNTLEKNSPSSMKKVINFNTEISKQEEKVVLKSDIQYLADAIMKLTEILSEKL